ncbi:MAG: hypothetical protein H6618_02650 [Deltaproteobacteria bacterium]|nr:hypothetical protein [Deltaproteobacteria bacterium]
MPEAGSIDIESKRLDKFHTTLKQYCCKRNTFKDNVRVDVRHISFRASQTDNNIRRAIDNMHIAAIILGGRINYRTSNATPPMELALEGKLVDFSVTDWNTFKSENVDYVCVKVVVREKGKGKKHLVVTVYPDNSMDHKTTPEVNYEIW